MRNIRLLISASNSDRGAMCSWKRFAWDLLFSLRFEGEPPVSAGAGETGSGERVETVARRRLEGV